MMYVAQEHCNCKDPVETEMNFPVHPNLAIWTLFEICGHWHASLILHECLGNIKTSRNALNALGRGGFMCPSVQNVTIE